MHRRLITGKNCEFREYGFRPDFCEAADPESKGIVEHLTGYAKSDPMAAVWCAEVPDELMAGLAADRGRGDWPCRGFAIPSTARTLTF